MGPQPGSPPADGRIAALAVVQHGVVERRQLAALGLGDGAIAHRVRAGRLHRVHRGVYAVGHPRLSRQGQWLAGVLACGAGAALSHRSAAALWGIRGSDRARVDVIRPTSGHAREGIDVHRSALERWERTVVDAIPVTTVARTLVDLGQVLDARALERAFDEAEHLRLLDAAALEDVLARAAGRCGAGILRARLADDRSAHTRSELEDRFLALCGRAGLSRPGVNRHVWAGGRLVEVDFLWAQRRLVAEADGRAAHGTRAAFERDRAATPRSRSRATASCGSPGATSCTTPPT